MDCADIVLTTMNARYSHAAFGLRWLWANLGPLRDRALIREFTIQQPAHEIVEALLHDTPRVVGLGVYIWNYTLATEVAQILKGVRPDVMLIAGGPEATHEYEGTALFRAADYLVRGEGEHVFRDLAAALLHGDRPSEKVVTAYPAPKLDGLELPYAAYTEEDIARRVIYVEASRGCPFRCEFCLSSLDAEVREFPLDPFLAEMERLLDRGARTFKFVDRTFNLSVKRVETILRFFLGRWRDGMVLHFEIVPDRLSDRMLALMAEFPPGGLHLEIGIQTFNPESQDAISRRQDLDRTEAALRFLRNQTGALLHADLVAGLPGETWQSFGNGFDRLIALRPHEVQVGILKRLKGAPIARHAESHRMVFAAQPPYEIMQTAWLSFEQLQRIKRFARYFDLYHNSGNFPRTMPLLLRARSSAFDSSMGFADRLWAQTGRTHELPLIKQSELAYRYLTEAGADPAEDIAEAIHADFYRLPGRKEKLEFLPRCGAR